MAATVGFIGVGNMGNPMAGNVLKAGFPMTVFDLHAPAMENLVQAGAKRAASAQQVVDASEIVLTCLPMSPDVEALYLDSGGLIERAKPGTILIDLSSVLPSTPRKTRAAGQGARGALPGGARERGRERRPRGHARHHGGWRRGRPRPRPRRAARHRAEHLPRGSGRAPATP